MSSHEIFSETLAVYALDGLDREERASFETHLASCEICRMELAEMRRVAAGLGISVDPVDPPPDLKARTIARAIAQPQPAARVPAQASAAPAVGIAPWLAAAAGLVLSAALGLYAVSLRAEVTRLREVAAAAQARTEELRAELSTLSRDSFQLRTTVNVLTAPDTIEVGLRGAPGAPEAVGRAYVSGDRGLVFVANRLPPLPAGRIYQLWVIPPESSVPLSAGVFSVDASGASQAFSVALPAGAERVKTVAVTNEPAPFGSAKASTPILLVGSTGD